MDLWYVLEPSLVYAYAMDQRHLLVPSLVYAMDQWYTLVPSLVYAMGHWYELVK